MDNLSNKISNLIITDSHIITIQKYYRGYYYRKNMKKPRDNMSLNIVEKLLDRYIETLLFLEDINKQLSSKKCRNENFPSHISENIVKFVLLKKYKVMPCWDTKNGDLGLLNKKIEVKGFMSDGPSSFGPKENWTWIYFIDCKDCRNKNFKVYEIKLSNVNSIWRDVKISKSGKYGEIADSNKRGQLRGCFYKIFKLQLEDHCRLIFDGHISELF